MTSSDAETVVDSKVPNRWMLIGFIIVGVVLVVGSVILFGYQFIHDSGIYGCTNEVPPSYVVPDPLVPKCTGIQWYEYVPSGIVGLFIILLSSDSYTINYVNVFSGEVTQLNKTYGVFGAIYHELVIEGKTRAGETRTEKRQVSWRTWSKLKEGETYSWSL